jgi:dihydroneopterin aldolase
MTEDTVSVYIRDCRVDLRVGADKREQDGKTQPVLINLECAARLGRRYDDINERSLNGVIDYKPFYHFIRVTLPAMGHIYLLESAAEQIAAFCFRDPRIESVRVRIEKTAIFDHAAGGGVELIRVRR